MTLAAIGVVLVAGGACGSDTQGGAETTDAEITVTAPDGVPNDPAELRAELERSVDDSDLCAFNAVFATNRVPVGSADYVPTLKVFADALDEMAPELDDGVRPSVDVLVAQTHEIIGVLESNGGDTTDERYLEIQRSSAATDAQREYTEWIDRNCATTGSTSAAAPSS